MDKFVSHLKNRADLMTDDQLVYLFVPEMIEMRTRAEETNKTEAVAQYNEVLEYVKKRVELETVSIASWGIEKTKLVVPSPGDIITGKSPQGIPNN